MITNQNIPRNTSESASASLKYRIWYARVRDEVDMDNWPASENATISAIPMKAGKYFHSIDCRADSVRPNAQSVGDIAPSGELTIVADISGLSKTMLQLFYANNGEDMVVIWEHCQTKQKFVAGSPCSGLIFSYTKLGTDENSTGASVQWKGKCPEPFLYFDGEVPTADPSDIAEDATTFALAADAAYKVGENSQPTAIASITNVTDADVNRIIEVIGNGSDNATTIAASAVFILRNGATFVAQDGASITFQIVKVGVATYAFYELSRS